LRKPLPDCHISDCLPYYFAQSFLLSDASECFGYLFQKTFEKNQMIKNIGDNILTWNM